jgi:L-aspartate oxidase
MKSSESTQVRSFDMVIVGSGLAGLSVALLAAPELRIAILTKQLLHDGASELAQGGIAAVIAEDDSFDFHVEDTLVAGAGLCDKAATRLVVENAPTAIGWLRDMGVAFTLEDDSTDQLHLTREGGHSQRRIVHMTDATGAAVQETLMAQVRRRPNVSLFEHHTLVDLITTHKLQSGTSGANRCLGLYAYDESRDEVITLGATHTVLATGGAGKVYLYTTNPDTATGDGIAAAWRAGCRVSNMEFVQFHPTCLYHPHAKSFLISEAVRGEGGRLVLPDGTRFMAAHDARLELAPRDVVARAIDFEMKKHGLDCVYLDISHQSPAFLQTHFPTILARCLELGIDITKQPIPVVPAAHYTCGGVQTDLRARTDIDGLYAVGETACTGLHGANRLASNSLLECMVFARAAVQDMAVGPVPAQAVPAALPLWDDSRVTDADESVVISHNWDELRRFMWDYVGIVRTNKRLERAAHRITLLQGEITEFYANFHVSRDLLELRNLVQVAELIVRSAQSRHESRGLHFSRDYPHTDEVARPTVLQPGTVTARG